MSSLTNAMHRVTCVSFLLASALSAGAFENLNDAVDNIYREKLRPNEKCSTIIHHGSMMSPSNASSKLQLEVEDAATIRFSGKSQVHRKSSTSCQLVKLILGQMLNETLSSEAIFGPGSNCVLLVSVRPSNRGNIVPPTIWSD